MKRIVKRVLAIVLCVCLSLGVFDGIAYFKLSNVVVVKAAATADGLASLAEAQYNAYHGLAYDNRYGTGAWCAHFVNWCARDIGLSTDVIPDTGRCTVMYNGMISKGAQVVTSPQRGDLVFYYKDGSWCHVGIMISSTMSIQGNINNTWYKMSPNDYINDGKIAPTYVRPNYPVTSHKPQGCFDTATNAGDGKIRLTGWAFDEDSPSKSLNLHIYVGGAYGSGVPMKTATANVSRPDVNKAYGITGNHGFDVTISTTFTGKQPIYIYIIDDKLEANHNTRIDKTMTISVPNHKPKGCFDTATNAGDGKIRLTGWAFDDDSPSKSLNLHIYVGGAYGSGVPMKTATANVSRPDVNKAYGITGNHGFDVTISTTYTGKQPIYIYIIDDKVEANHNTRIDKTMTISSNIIGKEDNIIGVTDQKTTSSSEKNGVNRVSSENINRLENIII